MFIVVSALAWAGIIIDSFIVDVLNGKGFAVLCMFTALVSVLLAMQWHQQKGEQALRANSESVARELRANSDRMEQALQVHAEIVSGRGADVSQLANKIDRAVGLVAVEAATKLSGSHVDTGPFPVFDSRSLR